MMKKLFLRILLLALAVIALWLVLPRPAVQAHPPGQPPIPHTLEGHTECTACHATGLAGAPKYPPDHEGRTNDMCLVCHVQAKVTAPAVTPTSTAEATASSTTEVTPTVSATTTPQVQPTAATGGPPTIPHSLQGRENCLACHATGLGGAPKVPADHAGRTVEMCRTCHQSAQPPEGEIPQIVPTPIPHPRTAATQDSCVTCHTNLGGNSGEVANEWSGSIHAQRNVSCADCHGGDPTKATKEEAMSLSAGFVGKPKTVDIPALCASCHSDVEAMRQYDLPTDQWTKYQQSVHGKKLAQGDTNVATCFVCHDGHATKAVNDPAAKVYPLNVPALCGSCHANAELMKPYNIPTNQYDLYKKSVHGIALLQNQDLRAPSCATCHGTHGAAPPGFQEVSNVCGSCHSATQDYYLQSVHASNVPGTPKCVTCHGRYDVTAPSEAMFEGEGARQCGSCHTATSPQAKTVQEIDKNLRDSAAAVDQAAAAIQRAAGSALIVAPEEVKLAEARTNLITSRAAQHTLSLSLIKEGTDKATAKAKEIIADADKAQADSIFRRQFMGVGLAIMVLAIGSLYIIRRELYKQLPKK